MLEDVRAPAYAYSPLHGKDSIRVLKLLPTTSRLECLLQETSIGDLQYQALSYVWGDLLHHSDITVRGENGSELGSITITKNLSSALEDLRDSDEITEKTFWVDQICIDQDGDEKGAQVQKMGEIFGWASRVITYLGPTSHDEQRDIDGIRVLNTLYEHFSGNYDHFFELGSAHDTNLHRERLPIRNLPEYLRELAGPDHWEWEWLATLAYGEWTQRWLTLPVRRIDLLTCA